MNVRANAAENSVLLLYAGRISPEKNINLLVEMMKMLAADGTYDYRLMVAGAGPRSEWLAEQTEKLYPGKIVQLGHLDKDTLANYYANADVFVHPNPREPFGISAARSDGIGRPDARAECGRYSFLR